jgi:hypothetical protein
VTAVSSASLATVAGVADTAADAVLKPIQQYRKHNAKGKGVADIASPDVVPAAVPSGVSILPLMKEGLIEELPADLVGHEEPHKSAAGAIVGASAQSMGKALVRSTRGVLVDIPLAATEGMRAVPQLWGEKVESHEKIEDFRSGVHVAGKSFFSGITGAVKCIFVRTYEGKRDKGALGAVKGLGQGAVGLATKSGAAVAGLATHPAQGISTSIRAKARGETRRRIIQARWREGEWLLENGNWTKDERSKVNTPSAIHPLCDPHKLTAETSGYDNFNYT